MLPFDHRATFSKTMFGWKGQLTAEQTAEIAAVKQVIYDAFQSALSGRVPKEQAGILVDEQFGSAILREAANKGYITSRFSVLHVREGGKWLMAFVREWPAEKVSLYDLEWLIGTWVAKRDDAEIHTTYEWMWDKSFIRVQFTICQKERTLRGFQMIGKDEASGELRSWTFESEGGFGEATWSRDGKRWVLDAAGRLSNGSTLTATIILVPLDQDSFTWQPVKRSIGDEEVEDLPPIRVTRVKQKR